MNFCSAAHLSAQGTITCRQPVRFSLLVAASGRLFKAFSGFASPGILYSFQWDFRTLATFDAHYQRFGKYIWQPVGRKEIPTLMFESLENGSQKQSKKKSTFWNFVSCNQQETLNGIQVCTGYSTWMTSCLIKQNFHNKYEKKAILFIASELLTTCKIRICFENSRLRQWATWKPCFSNFFSS